MLNALLVASVRSLICSVILVQTLKDVVVHFGSSMSFIIATSRCNSAGLNVIQITEDFTRRYHLYDITQRGHAVLKSIARHAIIHRKVHVVLFYKFAIPQCAEAFQIDFFVRLWFS